MPRPSFPHILTHAFRGRKFRILWKRPKKTKKTPKNWEYFGEVDLEKRRMVIHPSKDPEELLGTIIHECFHAACYDVEDSVVDHFEQDTMRLLRRMGLTVTFEPKNKL